MHLLDANVLIYTFRRDSPYHQRCYGWLAHKLAEGSPLATTSIVEVALIRIATLPILGNAAAAAIDVFRFLAALKSRENVFRIEPGDRHFTLFLNLCVDLKLRGNDVNDAHLVALALENNATLVTADRGFGRFSGLRVFDPLEGPKP